MGAGTVVDSDTSAFLSHSQVCDCFVSSPTGNSPPSDDQQQRSTGHSRHHEPNGSRFASGVQIDLEVPLERAEVAKPGPKTVVPCRGLVPTPFPGLRQYPLNTEHGALRLGDDIDKLLHMAQIPS